LINLTNLFLICNGKFRKIDGVHSLYGIRRLAISVNLNKTNAIQPQRIRQMADRGNAEFLFIVFIEISVI